MELFEEFKVEWKKTGCSIMSNGWTDKKSRLICSFLVNSPKGTIFLTSIDTFDSKTADKVFEMFDMIVEKVGEENVVQVVIDNTANYKVVGEMPMEKMKGLYWTPCAAHCIDLILEDFEKNIKVHVTTIIKARRISTYIYSKTLLIFMLRHFTKGRDLIRPTVTCFATTYLTLGALMTMFTSKSWEFSSFEPILEIVDERWELQLHRPLHAVAYYLNPYYHYSPNFKVRAEIKIGLYKCIERMVKDSDERCKIDMQIELFKDAKGLFGFEAAKLVRDKNAPAKCSFGCERNWSAFDMVHTKRRNRLHQKKMNDLVFVMYNLKLRNKQFIKDEVSFGVDELSSDDEWITEESSLVFSSNGSRLDILDGATRMESGESEEIGEDNVVHDHDNNDDEEPSKPLGGLKLGGNDIFYNISDCELEDDTDFEDADDDGSGHSLDEDLNISINDLFYFVFCACNVKV
ncbi:uncharacterized protein LOC127794517 [Diospyros lotus]|uniref:uncharacterized protein LOC127794517 n=1 Tax=Diospyros lotus TaxID=55363 RepID=UPI002253E3E1|nr:uncharacterized protein LOC127794517 [Diospyros lotus]